MVQINLLPVSAKKKRKRNLELKVKLGPIIFVLGVLVAVIIVIWAMLGIQLAAQGKKMARLDGELKSLKSTLQELDQMKQAKESLSDRLKFLDEEIKREILWSENLNRLSNLIPPGIWLKNIVLHSKEEERGHKYIKLDINGSAVSAGGEEMIDLIGKFMSALKQDEVFSEQFSEIKLISSQRGKSAKVEVMDFKLLCQFK